MSTNISIVIPSNNEALTINSIFQNIKKAFDKTDRSFEVIFVDDGSTDNSVDLLKKIAQNDSHLRIIRHKTNYGQSSAILTGVRFANNNIIVILDGDGQYDPQEIPKLIDLLADEHDENLQMVSGFRKKRKDNHWRKFSSRVANKTRQFLLKDNTEDTGCGLKVFYKDAFLALPHFNHMHRFLPALIKRQGGRVKFVEVKHYPRKFGLSHYHTLPRLWAGIIDILGVMWLIKRSQHIDAFEVTLHGRILPPE